MLGKITVGNVWDTKQPEKVYHYIGRKSKYGNSALYNPWPINHRHSREFVLAAYEKYLPEQLQGNTEFIAEMNQIADQIMTGKDVVLTCYCKGHGRPEDVKACHGDIIKRVIEDALKKRNES